MKNIIVNSALKAKTNILKKSLYAACLLLVSSYITAADVTFVMADIFDGSSQTAKVTTPTAATVSTTTSKSNAKTGKLGSDGHYFEVILDNETFTAASINGYINTTSTSKNWAFTFSTDGGKTWETEQTQANDGNKTAHDIAVNVTTPAGANGFRVIRRAGTSTILTSITLSIGASGPAGPVAVTGVTLDKTSLSIEAGQTAQLTATVQPGNADNQAVTWSSSDNNVVSVDATGKITANTKGSATITVTTADGGKTATCTVTVTEPAAPVAVTGVTLNKNRL